MAWLRAASCLVAACLVVASVGAEAPSQAADPELASGTTSNHHVHVKWVLAAYPRGQRGVFVVDDSIQLAAGDRLRLFVGSDTRTQVYLFRVDAGELDILLPRTLDRPPGDVSGGEPVYLPSARDSWVLEPSAAGGIKFYLVAAAGKLPALESQMRAFQTASAARKQSEGGKLLATILNFDEKQTCRRVSPSELVPVMGSDPDIAAFAKPLDADRVIVRMVCVDRGPSTLR